MPLAPVPLVPGLRAGLSLTVGQDDTAAAVGSGDVPVLATPRLLALAEAATVAALLDHLDPALTSVGTSVTLEHRAASPVGAQVVVTAELTAVDGRRLTFAIEAHEGARLVGDGQIHRVVVDREKFLSRAEGN